MVTVSPGAKGFFIFISVDNMFPHYSRLALTKTLHFCKYRDAMMNEIVSEICAHVAAHYKDICVSWTIFLQFNFISYSGQLTP